MKTFQNFFSILNKFQPVYMIRPFFFQTLLSVLTIDKRINPDAINGDPVPPEKSRFAFPWLFSIELARMERSMVQLSTT